LTAALATVLVITPLVGWTSEPWLVLAVPIAMFSYGGLLMELGAPQQPLMQRHVGLAAVTAAALVASVEMIAGPPTWAPMATGVLAVAGGVLWLAGDELGVRLREWLSAEPRYQ
jgi:hypothetical protein